MFIPKPSTVSDSASVSPFKACCVSVGTSGKKWTFIRMTMHNVYVFCVFIKSKAMFQQNWVQNTECVSFWYTIHNVALLMLVITIQWKCLSLMLTDLINKRRFILDWNRVATTSAQLHRYTLLHSYMLISLPPSRPSPRFILVSAIALWIVVG